MQKNFSFNFKTKTTQIFIIFFSNQKTYLILLVFTGILNERHPKTFQMIAQSFLIAF